MQPERLGLEALGIQIGRPLRLFLCRPNIPSGGLDEMAAPAVFLRDELTAIHDGLRSLVPHFERYRILHQTDEHAGNRFHILLAEAEVRHLQKFLWSLTRPTSKIRGSLSFCSYQARRECSMGRNPKSSWEISLLPASVNSVPIGCAFSKPGTLWQPKQPLRLIKRSPVYRFFCSSVMPFSFSRASISVEFVRRNSKVTSSSAA